MGSTTESAPTNGLARPVAVVQGSALTVSTLLGRAAPRYRPADTGGDLWIERRRAHTLDVQHSQRAGAPCLR